MLPDTPGKTTLRRDQQYLDRWTNAAQDSKILSITGRLAPSDLRRIEIFRDYDDAFLEKISPDISIAKWQSGTVLFEEGSYIDLAFFVLRGEVVVLLEKLRTDASGIEPTMLQSQIRKQVQERTVTLLTAMDVDLPAGESTVLGPGEFLGEIGALNGWPQSVTARTQGETTLVQIRVAALRELRRKSPALKQRLDALYRERSLAAQLRRTPLFGSCSERNIAALTQRVELLSFEPQEAIVQQGDSVEALYIVRSGFVKLSQRVESGDVAVTYLSKGMTLGESELLLSPAPTWLWTATSVANTELACITRTDFTALLRAQPELEPQLWAIAARRVQETGFTRKHAGRSEFIDTALGQGIVEGTSMLVIDLEVCTRCDDCVRACAATHDGIPRFVREGNKYQNLLLTRACFHCRDPLCLVGCPTGAIHRADVNEIVEISDALCIGCKACANNCPYDAIVMHDTEAQWPEDAIPQALRGKKRLLATKCDQCIETGHDPACVRCCPQACAVRVATPQQFRDLLSSRSEPA